jgi:hypothetical protein
MTLLSIRYSTRVMYYTVRLQYLLSNLVVAEFQGAHPDPSSDY